MHQQHGVRTKTARPPLYNFWVLLASLLLCLGLSLLGGWFANPFGLTSVIWPVTGVMLGLYLVFGWPVAIALLVGLSISYHNDAAVIAHFPAQSAFLFAILMTSHVVMVKWLIEKSFNLPLKTSRASEIVKFLIFTGPISALPVAIIFALGLFYSDLAPQVIAYLSVTKWVGDLFSIIFITPIILFTYPNHIVKKARKPLAASITSVLAYCMIGFLFNLSQTNFENQRQQQFINSTRPFVEQINSAQSTIKLYLKALEAFFQASEVVSRQEFSDFTAIVQDERVQIRAIGWLPLVPEYNRSEFEAELAREQLKHRTIQQLTPSGFTKAATQPFYLPIQYLAPLSGNESAIGLDVISHPIAGPAVKAAIEQGTFVVTPLLSLAQAQNKTTGVVVYYPVFRKNSPALMQTLIGVTEVVLELEVLLDPQQGVESHWMFSYQLSYGERNVYPQLSNEAAPLLAHQVELNLFDKKGLINFYSSDAFDLTLINWAGFFIIVIGTALGVVCVMFVFFIVSYNSSLTKKVNESTQALQKKNDELVQANEAKNLFLANISHEYRTPLNAIMGFCEIAQRESKEPQTHNYLEKIHDASLLLLGIVNDVLDFSKMQAGQLSLDACEFNPAQAAEAAVEMLRDKVRDKGLTLTTHYEPLFYQQMEGDDIRFKQIIINLLNNALKFTEAGSITLDAKATLEGDTYYLTICVRDTGIGIASEHQTKLFQSFSQAESATTRKYGGTGLGLSIVKQLSNLMGGDVTLSSELSKGSEFVVTLQLKKASQLTAPQSEKEDSLNDVDLSGMSVLVVEDNKINQIIVEKHLQNLSVKCALANDGQDALDYLQTHTPDLILMDLQMPNMDGFTASEFIKKSERLRTIPIVILSASVGKVERDKAKELGIDNFINKPFNLAELKAILMKYQQ
ncbi:hypothetical protein PULV_a0280 [Pseudoalteromonas ulvae UL12]|uniref:CHASE domain-containing protein n=1 Tax=Pseudoalteromonas ulvae TaxID=107327 RepID=UPI00186B5FEE|nr:CHASE domain-containing protein [Pseudoalteromonas ulvae]MBE0362730.1 hypothetical protein [Pseudoalteromonas ulvae UL12]